MRLGPKSSLYLSRDGVEGVMGAKVADGVDGCIREVRRQIGVGSDWIKVPVYVPLLRIVYVSKRSPENVSFQIYAGESGAP